MKPNFIFYLILFIFLKSCGYTPIYKNIDDVNFKIQISDFFGERKINNLIKSNLENYNFRKSKKVYNVKVNSKYTKNIIAKDSTGAATEYKVIIDVAFTVSTINLNDEYNFKESFNMQSMNDKLDEQDYEENIQSNLVNTITRKFILKLSRLP